MNLHYRGCYQLRQAGSEADTVSSRHISRALRPSSVVGAAPFAAVAAEAAVSCCENSVTLASFALASLTSTATSAAIACSLPAVVCRGVCGCSGEAAFSRLPGGCLALQLATVSADAQAGGPGAACTLAYMCATACRRHCFASHATGNQRHPCSIDERLNISGCFKGRHMRANAARR